MSVVKKLLDGPDILGVLKRIAQSDIGPVSAEKKLCLNFRWKKCCSLCAEVCPVSAIDAGELKIDGSRCIACGVCALVCPSGALTFEARDRASLLADIDDALGRGDVVLFICDRCGGALGKAKTVKGAVSVPCLSMLDEALVLECYSRGAGEVRLQNCSPECAFGPGRTIYKETLRLAGELRRALVLRTLARRAGPGKTADASGPAPGEPHRRAFIAGAGRELLKAAYQPDSQEANKDRWTWLHRLPERRAALLRLIEKPAAGKHVLRRPEGSRFADIRADRALCSTCGACGALCPTGAVGTAELDESSMLYFNFGWCTGCLLCVRACPERALRADDRLDLGALAGNGVVLLKHAAARCGKCSGRYIPGRTGGECPACKKREVKLGPARKGLFR
jgi:ferredoxin